MKVGLNYLGRPGETRARVPPQNLSEGHTHLEPRGVASHAGGRADAVRKLRIRPSRDVESLGILEHLGVSIFGTGVRYDLVTLADLLIANLRVAQSSSSELHARHRLKRAHRGPRWESGVPAGEPSPSSISMLPTTPFIPINRLHRP